METARSFEERLDWIREKVPVLPTIPAPEEQQERREKDTPYNEYSTYQSLVAKTIPTREAMKVPGAKAALDREWKSLWSLITWLVEAASEYDEVRSKVSKEGRTVHLG